MGYKICSCKGMTYFPIPMLDYIEQIDTHAPPLSMQPVMLLQLQPPRIMNYKTMSVILVHYVLAHI